MLMELNLLRMVPWLGLCLGLEISYLIWSFFVAIVDVVDRYSSRSGEISPPSSVTYKTAEIID